jgi:hypothetical protein
MTAFDPKRTSAASGRLLIAGMLIRKIALLGRIGR